MKLTEPSIAERVQTEGDAYLLMVELRWGGQVVCPADEADEDDSRD